MSGPSSLPPSAFNPGAADAHPGWRRWGQVLSRGAIGDQAGLPQVAPGRPVLKA